MVKKDTRRVDEWQINGCYRMVAYIHIYIYIYIFIHTHTHIYIHTMSVKSTVIEAKMDLI